MPTDGAPPSVLAQVRRLQEFAQNSGAPLQIEEISETGAVAVASNVQIFEDGALVANRFQIVRRLGRGGMGEVYEAFDQINRAKVALKVLRHDVDVSGQSAERFIRREFLLTQRIAHPNICRVNDLYLHQTDTRSFLVVSMEFIAGSNLADVFTQRGALPEPEVQNIARQLIAGIAAAHAAGVIHRDLKPANLMIVAEPGSPRRLVITDFGLARSDHDTSSTLANLKGFAGTLRYAAPEQIEGEATTASDIYAACLILYEILTGGFPFSGSTSMAVALNRLATQPRDPARFLPNIPLNWRLALLKGLDRDPKKRFADITELGKALESPTGARLKLRWLYRQVRLHAKLAAAITIAVVASLLVPLLWPKHQAPPPAFTTLLFAGLTHAPSADPVISAAELSLLSSLRQSPHLTVSTTPETAATFQRMGKPDLSKLQLADLREAALRTGRNALLTGGVSNSGHYRLHLELQPVIGNPTDTSKTFTQDFDAANSEDMFRAIANAAEWVRKLSGESRSEFFEQDVQPPDLTTGSWRALHLYQEARLRNSVGDSNSALTFLDEATSLDPGFAGAESLRGDILGQLHRCREMIQAHRRALSLVKARNITGRERFQIEAMFNSDIGDDTAEQKTYQQWIAHFQTDSLPRFASANIFYRHGDFSRALQLMKSAEKLDPNNYVIQPHLASIYLAMGRTDDLNRCITRLRDLNEPQWATYVKGFSLAADSRFELAAQTFQPLVGKNPFWTRLASFSLANSLAAAGHPQNAETALRNLIDQTEDKADRAEATLAIAYLRWTQHDFRSVKSMLLPILADFDNPACLSEAGALLARSGSAEGAARALALLNSWPSIPSQAEAIKRLEAEISVVRIPSRINRVFASINTKEKSPAIVDLLLYLAVLAQRTSDVLRIRQELTAWPALVLEGRQWLTFPGLYRIANCGGIDPAPSKTCGS